MTYLECTQLFKDSVAEIAPDSTFVGGLRPDASLASTTANWPMIWLAPFREIDDRETNNRTRNIVLFFITQDSTNNTQDERDVLVNDMYVLKEAFISNFTSRILGKGIIQGKINATPEVKTFPGYCSG